MLSLLEVGWNEPYVSINFMHQMNFKSQQVALYLEQTINVLKWLLLVEEHSLSYGLKSLGKNNERNSGGTLQQNRI